MLFPVDTPRHSNFGGDIEVVLADGQVAVAQVIVVHSGPGALFFPEGGWRPDADVTEFTVRFPRGDGLRLRWLAQSDTPRGTLVLVERVP